MSEELWGSFYEASVELNFQALWLGSQLEDVMDREAVNVAGVIIQLDEKAIAPGGRIPRSLERHPLAGLPLTPTSREIAKGLGIETIIEDPDTLASWVLGLAPLDVTSESELPGKVIVVWGPHGSPGRTMLAIKLAGQLSLLRKKLLLVDADTQAPSIALNLGLSGGISGLAGALRSARNGSPTPQTLLANSQPFSHRNAHFDVFTGITARRQMQELEAEALSEMLRTLSSAGWVVVVDVAAGVASAAEVATAGGSHFRATHSALQAADTVVALTKSAPLDVARFSQAWPELHNIASRARIMGVMRGSPVASKRDPSDALAALWQFTGLEDFQILRHGDEGALAAAGERSKTGAGKSVGSSADGVAALSRKILDLENSAMPRDASRAKVWQS